MSRFDDKLCLKCGAELTPQQNLYCSRDCCRSMLMKRRWVRKNYVSHCCDSELVVYTSGDGGVLQKCSTCKKKCKRAKVYFPIMETA